MRTKLAALLLALLALSPVAVTAAEPGFGSERLAALRRLDLDAAFREVATKHRYEPYAGVLRGALGTAASHGGNAADKSLLLADILRARGFRVRFVQGTLQGENLDTLLRGLYPPDLPKISVDASLGLYDPLQDQRLRALAAAHVWIEVAQPDGTWLPLDPSFPRATAGEAYAQAGERRDALPPELYQRLTLVVHEELQNGRTRELGRTEATVAALAFVPVSLSVTGIPQGRAAEAEAGGMGAMFGAIAGDDAAAKEKAKKEAEARAAEPPVATRHRRGLQIGDRRIPVQATLVQNDKPDSRLRREWLELTLTVPGQAPRKIVRDLFVADAPGGSGTPAAYRRYSWTIVPGPLETDDVAAYTASRAKDPATAELPKLAAQLGRDKGVEIDRLDAADSDAALLAGTLSGIAFAAEADVLSERIARNFGTALSQSSPRLLIVGVEGEADGRMRTALDLRLDEIDAWPYPGHARNATALFQDARGVQQSMLEGLFLARLLPDAGPAVTTAGLMSALSRGNTQLTVLGPKQQEGLSKLPDLPPYARRLLQESLAAGRAVAIPSKPVEIAGRARYGWWDIDPVSGRVVGVMEDGLHQAMADYAVNTEQIGMNDRTGFILGAMMGGITAQGMIAGGILKYGGITKQLIADLEKALEQTKCFSCPNAERKVEAKAEASYGCLKIEKAYAAGGTAAQLSFCDSYVKGFGCTAGLILQGLKGQSSKLNIAGDVTAESKFFCAP